MRLEHKLFKSTKPGKWKRVLTLDPGLRNTGFAFWPVIERGPRAKTRAPKKTGVIKAPGNVAWENAVHEYQAEWLVQFIEVNRVELVIAEFVEVWGDSARSLQAAKRGDLLRLAYLIGAIGQTTYAFCDRKAIMVKPTEWKGDMPKAVMKRRVRRALHTSYREHEYDAVALGLRIMGKL